MALKAIQLSTDLVTVAEFKDHAGTYLDRVQSSGHPIVITKNGKAVGVIISPAEYDRIQYKQAFMESVARGVADGDAGRVKSTQDAKREIESARAAGKNKK
jgi:prevent-host-death family protein